MRNITQDSVDALINSREFSRQNMTVTRSHGTPGFNMMLHNNMIASKMYSGCDPVYVLRDAGWQTATTKERLNGVLEAIAPGYRIRQKDHVWYIVDPDGIESHWTGAAAFHNGLPVARDAKEVTT